MKLDYLLLLAVQLLFQQIGGICLENRPFLSRYVREQNARERAVLLRIKTSEGGTSLFFTDWLSVELIELRYVINAELASLRLVGHDGVVCQHQGA